MTNHSPRTLRASAADILANTPNEKRLVLLWVGASALLSLLTGLLSYLLDTGIAGTGGLSGIGLRSILATAREVLSTALSIVLPFWTLGYQHTMLRLSRRQRAGEASLLEGFRRFGPGLRLMLLQYFLMGGIFVFVFYVVLLFLAMTPLATPALEAIAPIAEPMMSDPTWLPDDATAAALVEAILPLSLCCMAVAVLALIPVAYRLRFAQLRLLDEPRCGALEAMRTSGHITRGHCKMLFRLDLGFWWFWLLKGLITAVSLGGTFLPQLGISLPISADVAFWVFYVAALALETGVYLLFHNRVSVTYALYYDSLLPKPEEPTA